MTTILCYGCGATVQPDDLEAHVRSCDRMAYATRLVLRREILDSDAAVCDICGQSTPASDLTSVTYGGRTHIACGTCAATGERRPDDGLAFDALRRLASVLSSRTE